MRKIGRYIIHGLLGHGGMSKVYRVSLPLIGGTSALKLLDPHPSLTVLLDLKTIREQFRAEARTMASLRHPNIVAIKDFDEADGKLFYVMEHFSNNLGDLIGEIYRTEAPSRILSIEKTIHYSRQILQGVARLHHNGLIHRDIKPFNLLITEEDCIKICDFGLSTLRGEKSTNPDNLKVGSPFYAAPEQETSPGEVGFESDIFSIGVIIYRMLTGRLPYEDTDAIPTAPSRLNPHLDTDWDNFIFHALHQKPSKRFSSVNRMGADLEKLAAAWAQKKEAICHLMESQSVPTSTSPPTSIPHIRSKPLKVPTRIARDTFKTDSLGQPLCFQSYDFQRREIPVITDPRGLFWQQSGSEYPLIWKDAHAYIEKLNRRSFAGLNSWRLPTIEELLSLLTPPGRSETLCMDPVFDGKQKWLWSADRHSFTSAWYVNVELGFVSKNDFSALYFARAVSSASKAPI